MLHPHDAALLYDLCDGRLGPAAAEELRRRIAEERELSDAWDDLRRLRASLRALPAPPVPEGFLAAVRARAGLPPSTPSEPEEASTGPVSRAAPDRATGPEGAVGGRVLRLRPFFYAAAATLGVGLGVTLWFATNEARGTKEAVHAVALERRSEPPPPYAAAGTPEAKDQAATDGPQGPFRAPGGGVPPGLRKPSDSTPSPSAGAAGTPRAPATREPSGPAAGAPPVALGRAGGGSGPGYGRGAAPGPTSPGAVPPPAEAPAPAAPAPVGPPPAPPPTTVPPPPPAPAPAPEPAPAAPPAPRAAEGDREGGMDTGTAPPSKRQDLEEGDWAREGVVQVLVFQAESLDAGRAEVALLTRALAAPAAPVGGKPTGEPPKHALPLWRYAEPTGAPKSEGKPRVDRLRADPGYRTPDARRAGTAGAMDDDKDGSKGGQAAEDSERSRASAAPVVLGSILLDLSEAEWARLQAMLPSEAKGPETWKKEASDGAASKAPPSTPATPTPEPAGEVEKPAPDKGKAPQAGAGGDEAPPPRRIRILVVGR